MYQFIILAILLFTNEFEYTQSRQECTIKVLINFGEDENISRNRLQTNPRIIISMDFLSEVALDYVNSDHALDYAIVSQIDCFKVKMFIIN